MENILTEFADYFSKSSLWSDIIRQFGYWIAKQLYAVTGFCTDLYLKVYDLLDFTNYGVLRNFIAAMKPLWIALLAASICFLGITLIVNTEKPKKVPRNILLSIFVISSMTLFITQINAIFVDYAKAGMGLAGETVTSRTISKNMVDLLYADKHNALDRLPVNVPGLTEDYLDMLDATEKVRPDQDDISDTAKEVFGHYRTLDSEGNPAYEEFEDGWIFEAPYYYRYDFDFFTIYVTYLATIIAFLCTAYKAVRLIYEIAVHEVLAFLYATEITGGQKLVKILDSVKNLYIVLFFTSVFLKVFQIFGDYIAAKDYSSFVKCFFLICAAFAVIDGPNIIQRVTGIDAGLSSGFGKLAAAYTVGRGAVRSASSLAFGNPMTGRSGLFRNSATRAAKETAGRGKDFAAAGIGYGAGKAASKLFNAGGAAGNGDAGKKGMGQEEGKKNLNPKDPNSVPGMKSPKESGGMEEQKSKGIPPSGKDAAMDKLSPDIAGARNGTGEEKGDSHGAKEDEKSLMDDPKKNAVPNGSAADAQKPKEKNVDKAGNLQNAKNASAGDGNALKKDTPDSKGSLANSEKSNSGATSGTLAQEGVDGKENLNHSGPKMNAEAGSGQEAAAGMPGSERESSFLDELMEERKADYQKETGGYKFGRTSRSISYGFKKGLQKGRKENLK